MPEMNEYKEFIGQKIVSVEQSKHGEELVFHMESGEVWRMLHYQDCCESITIDSILGDFNKILNVPIVHAFEYTNEGCSNGESETWTYYTIGTNENLVTIRWYGESNGYYSESVDFRKDS